MNVWTIYHCCRFHATAKFSPLLERHLGSHHLHKGLSNGWLATVWLAFLLSQSNHRKVSVQDWAQNHVHTLETLIGQSLRPIEFADDRLSITLRRLHDAAWSALKRTFGKPPAKSTRLLRCIRLDADHVVRLSHDHSRWPDATRP